MTTPKAEIGQRLIALLDAVDEPISIASAIRDRGGRILDFRIEYEGAGLVMRDAGHDDLDERVEETARAELGE